MVVGKNIQYFRERRGITQQELAMLAGLSYSFVNDIENGRRDPSLESLYKMAKVLNVKAADLLSEETKEGNEKGKKAVKAVIQLFGVVKEVMVSSWVDCGNGLVQIYAENGYVYWTHFQNVVLIEG